MFGGGNGGNGVVTFRYLPKMAATASSAPLLMRPFSEILDDEKITDPLLRNWIDLLCFCLSGIPADGTPTVEVCDSCCPSPIDLMDMIHSLSC